jgi:hypothetical protein
MWAARHGAVRIPLLSVWREYHVPHSSMIDDDKVTGVFIFCYSERDVLVVYCLQSSVTLFQYFLLFCYDDSGAVDIPDTFWKGL